MEDFQEKKEYIKIEVAGKNVQIWNDFRNKLLNSVNRFLDTTIDHIDNKSIREEAKEFTHALLDHAKQKLKKSGLENEKIMAEIDQIFSQCQVQRAEARKLDAESEKLEFENAINKMRFSLKAGRILISSDESSESMIIIKQIDQFVALLDEYKYAKEN